MKHTNYFIEHILSGLGTMTWIGLMVITFVDINWANIMTSVSVEGFSTYISIYTLLMIPFVYITGIVADRLVDELFDEMIGNRLLFKTFKNKDAYTRIVAKIYYTSNALKENYEYGRMRIRICRVWAFNSFMCMVAVNLFLFFKFEESGMLQNYINTDSTNVWRLSLASTIFYLTSFLVTFRAWYTLSVKECEILHAQNEFLEEK